MRQYIAKLCFVIFYANLGLPCGSNGMVIEGPVAPELKDGLRCEVRLATNSVTNGSLIPIFLTVTNASDLEAELPRPGCNEMGMSLSVFLSAGPVTNESERSVLRSVALPADATPEQIKFIVSQPTDRWPYYLEGPRWIRIRAGGAVQVKVLVDISSRMEASQGVSPLSANYGLQCEIEYHMVDITSTRFMETNQWTSAEQIAKAKASGVFLVDPRHLWTGKMESNIVNLTITNQTPSSATEPPK